MSNELKANIADAQKFFDKTKCTSFAEVMVQYANSRPTEPKIMIAEVVEDWVADISLNDNGAIFWKRTDENARAHVTYGELRNLTNAILAICDEVKK